MALPKPSDNEFSLSYQAAFIQRCHEIVLLGHARLDPKGLAELDETAITGHLVVAMEAFLDAQDAPPWAVHFTAIDDLPESVDGKSGKRRPRVDITVRCINPRPSTSFRFEAKRLHSSKSVGAYLGSEGMLALITGHYGELAFAGMLGYVQRDSCSHWSERIKKAIEVSPRAYYAVEPVAFDPLEVEAQEPVFWSHHHYTNKRVSHITHTLLACA